VRRVLALPLQFVLEEAAAKMSGLLPQDIRAVAADAWSAAASEHVSLDRALEEANTWEELMQMRQQIRGKVLEKVLSKSHPEVSDTCGDVLNDAADGIEMKKSMTSKCGLSLNPSKCEISLNTSHFEAALSQVKARTATEVRFRRRRDEEAVVSSLLHHAYLIVHRHTSCVYISHIMCTSHLPLHVLLGGCSSRPERVMGRHWWTGGRKECHFRCCGAPCEASRAIRWRPQEA
jgi:hypothetical protein